MCGGGKHKPSIQSAMEASDEAGEPFHCLICLDLVYKPIVQSCGHVFCFWCVHRAMNSKRQSQCPVCRRPYIHFPRVCEMLHFFLMKAVPEEYSRRAQETQDMEETKQIFSPRLPESPISPRKGDDRDTTEVRKCVRRPIFPGEVNGVKQQRVFTDAHEFLLESTMDVFRRLLPSGVSVSGQQAEVDSQQDRSHSEDETCNELTVEDFSCASCNRFLYRPVALNCGQVFCESCVKTSGSFLSCPSCQDPHPGGSVHVCLELHHYLERAFPEYSLKRRDEVLSEQTDNESINSKRSDQEEDMAYISGQTERKFVHVGAGCDGCGMFPIVGDRYRCKDCSEKIGYDLCGACYRKGAILCGRFGQQHKPGHRMTEIFGEFRALPGALRLNLGNGIIQRRRRQYLLHDLDDYIGSFL